MANSDFKQVNIYNQNTGETNTYSVSPEGTYYDKNGNIYNPNEQCEPNLTESDTSTSIEDRINSYHDGPVFKNDTPRNNIPSEQTDHLFESDQGFGNKITVGERSFDNNSLKSVIGLKTITAYETEDGNEHGLQINTGSIGRLSLGKNELYTGHANLQEYRYKYKKKDGSRFELQADLGLGSIKKWKKASEQIDKILSSKGLEKDSNGMYTIFFGVGSISWNNKLIENLEEKAERNKIRRKEIRKEWENYKTNEGFKSFINQFPGNNR